MSDAVDVATRPTEPEPANEPADAPARRVTDRVVHVARRSGQTWLRPFALFAASRVVVLLAEAVAALLNPTKSFFQVAATWDSGYYVQIAMHGYPKTVPTSSGPPAQLVTAFFPGFSILIRIGKDLTGLSWFKVAFILAYGFSLLAAILLWYFVRELRDAQVADRAVALFCFFPGAFVLSMTYSEPMFIAVSIACLWALTRRQWVLAGVLAAVATFTRSNGLADCVACAFASGVAIYQRREWRSLIAPALSPLGVIVFFGYLWRHTGDARVWFKVQKYGWDQHFDPLVFPYAVKKFFQHPTQNVELIVTMASCAFLLGLLFFVPRSRLPWTLYVYGAVVIGMTMYTYLLPRPRFVLTAFPFLVAPVERLKPFTFQVLMVVMAGGLAILTAVTLSGIYVGP